MTCSIPARPLVSCPCGNPDPTLLGVRNGMAVIACCECLLAHTVRVPTLQQNSSQTLSSHASPDKRDQQRPHSSGASNRPSIGVS